MNQQFLHLVNRVMWFITQRGDNKMKTEIILSRTLINKSHTVKKDFLVAEYSY